MRHASKSVGERVRGAGGIANNGEFLSVDRCLEILRIMVRTRAMEERMIKMSKSGESYFWIGGPGEEAFHTCLGMQVNKGEGPDHDYLLLKYRSSATMVAMGMPMADSVRQMAMRRTDPFSMGRNFPSHFAKKEWNVIPVSSVIGTQFAVAPGTALVQKRRAGGEGVTVVVGGEAGTAEGDFASCLIWSTRPGNELPVLMIVMNNGWGISTSRCTVDSCEHVIDRGKAFGIPGEVVNGNDPVASWYALERAFQHCREKRGPYMLEANVSRLFGHSSSSGAPHSGEPDCIELFEQRLLAAGIMDENALQRIHDDAKAEADTAVADVMKEPIPSADDIKRHTYAPSDVDKFYPEDYTGLPGEK